MKLNCIITDDEPIAIDILKDYIKMVPELNLVATCNNAMEAGAIMRKEKIDLVFLDIQMPGINGIDFLKSLTQKPQVILTTAYPDYALQGFELDVVDYLLKPISLERFLQAVNKTFERMPKDKESSPEPEEKADKDYIFVKADNKLVKVKFDEILFVEGLKDYVKIKCQDRRIITLITMKHMNELLPDQNFLRVHRSYIINLNCIEAIEGSSFRIKDKLVPVGTSYRTSVFDLLKDRNIL